MASGKHVKFMDVEFFDVTRGLYDLFNRVVLTQNNSLSTTPATRIPLLNKGEAWVLVDVVKCFEVEYIAVFKQV